jgi:hypothetical protein
VDALTTGENLLAADEEIKGIADFLEAELDIFMGRVSDNVPDSLRRALYRRGAPWSASYLCEKGNIQHN